MAVGARIQELREAQNLTIEEIASITKIRKDVISNIEAEQWQNLDLRVFVRNQVRLIASALKADETELLNLFDQDLPQTSQDYANVSKSNKSELNIFDKQGKSALPAKRNPNLLYFVLGILVVVAIAVFAFFSSTKSTDLFPKTDVTLSQSPSPNPTESTDTNVNLLGVSVVLQASGRSWITATGSAGNSLFSSFLNAGDTITLNDSTSIALVIGDSGVVNVTVNDENLGLLGSFGSPIEITFPVQ